MSSILNVYNKQQFNADVSFNGAVTLGTDIWATSLASTSDANAVSYNTSTKKLGYVALPTSTNILPLNNTFTLKNGFMSDVSLNGANLYFGSIPSSSDANFIAYNSSTKQISYTPSLLGSNNTWSLVNRFQSNVFVTDKLTLGVSETGSSPTTVGFGTLNSFSTAYTSDTLNPTSWGTDFAALFSTSTTTNPQYCSAIGLCQTTQYENAIVCKRPAGGFGAQNLTNLTMKCNAFSVKSTQNMMVMQSNYIYIWYGNGGSTLLYFASWDLTTLVLTVFRSSASATYGYFDTNTGLWGSTSDARLKKDIKTIDLNLSKQFIMGISPVTYRLIEEDIASKNLGFIAQDVLLNAKTESQKNIVSNWKVYEEAMSRGEEPMEQWEDQNDKDSNGNPKKKLRKSYLGVSPTGFIPEIIGAVQLMNKENEELKLQISQQQAQMQAQIQALQSQIQALQSQIQSQNAAFEARLAALETKV